MDFMHDVDCWNFEGFRIISEEVCNCQLAVVGTFVKMIASDDFVHLLGGNHRRFHVFIADNNRQSFVGCQVSEGGCIFLVRFGAWKFGSRFLYHFSSADAKCINASSELSPVLIGGFHESFLL